VIARLSIIVLGLLCCAGIRPTAPGECRTVCGMTATQTTDQECAELRGFEEDVVHKVAEVPPLSPWGMCRAVDGWTIKIHPPFAEDRTGCVTGSWMLFPGFCARGVTRPESHVIEFNDSNWRPSSLAHEMVHVAELERTKGEGGHCWSPELRATLTEVTGRLELSRPEPDCP